MNKYDDLMENVGKRIQGIAIQDGKTIIYVSEGSRIEFKGHPTHI